VLNKALYGVGPGLGDAEAVRFADEMRVFDPERIALYKNPKMGNGYAEYYFELLYLEETVLPDGTLLPERQARLDIDEFIADMWNKGDPVRHRGGGGAAAIASTKADRITFATDLEPAAGPGRDRGRGVVRPAPQRRAQGASADAPHRPAELPEPLPADQAQGHAAAEEAAAGARPARRRPEPARITAPEPPKDLTPALLRRRRHRGQDARGRRVPGLDPPRAS
jgi:hypothetical protein